MDIYLRKVYIVRKVGKVGMGWNGCSNVWGGGGVSMVGRNGGWV